MRILVVTDSFPFPPKNGKDLPIAKIFTEISQKESIDLLLVSDGNVHAEELKKRSKIVNEVYVASYKRKNSSRRAHLYDGYQFDENSIKNLPTQDIYDWVWVAPYPCYSFIEFCKSRNLSLFDKVALGLNDELSYTYLNRFKKMFYQKSFSAKGIFWLFRSAMLKKEEKKIFGQIDLIHLQTEKEKKRLLKVVGDNKENNKKIVVAPNGIKEELLSCTYSGIDGHKVLVMTQLGDARREESKWFFEEVWPRVKKKIPELEVLVVGSPPKGEPPKWMQTKGIEILGYVDDLKSLYDSVSMVIVPTYHSSGLINRIQDALTAGVPIITTNKAVSTFPSLHKSRDILSTDKKQEFFQLIIKLYKDKPAKQKLSENGRKKALHLGTWRDAALTITKKLKEA